MPSLKLTSSPCLLGSCFLVILVAPILSAQEGWRQWRGDLGDSQVVGAWPETLTEGGLVQRWQLPLAEGYATPIVLPDRVFTVGTRYKKHEVVRALDRSSGEELWRVVWEGAMKVPFFARKNGSWSRATPATDGESLFVPGMEDVLVCLDVTDGSERWRVDFKTAFDSPLPGFGFCSSPRLDGDALYVQAGSAVRCLDKNTGALRWSAMEDKRAMYGSAFASPVLTMIGGKKQLLAQTREKLCGIDGATGELLWSTQVMAFRLMNILTPTPLGDGRIFTSTYGGGIFAFDVAKGRDGFSIAPVWNHEKPEGYMASPVVIDGLVYHFARDQHFYCIDPSEGAVLWKSKEKFGDYWSMVANGKKILALDSSGELLLLAADPQEFRLLGRVKVSKASTWGHVAIDGDEIFIRDLKGITAWKWEG